MATGFTDFSEYPTGQAPSDWTLITSGSTLSIVSGEGAVHGENVLRFDNSNQSPRGATWNIADVNPEPASGYIEIVTRAKMNWDAASASVHFLGTGFLRATSDITAAAFLKPSSGVSTANHRHYSRVAWAERHAAINGSVVALSTDWRYQRCRWDFGALEIFANCWLGSFEDEPALGQVALASNGYIAANASNRIGVASEVTGICFYDFIGWGVNEPAPGPVVSPVTPPYDSLQLGRPF